MSTTIRKLESQLLAEQLKELFNKAYQEGVEDGKRGKELPHLLNKDNLAEIFQVSKPTIENIIRIEGFPKANFVQARYPKEQVFEWIDKNIEYVTRTTNYFGKTS